MAVQVGIFSRKTEVLNTPFGECPTSNCSSQTSPGPELLPIHSMPTLNYLLGIQQHRIKVPTMAALPTAYWGDRSTPRTARQLAGPCSAAGARTRRAESQRTQDVNRALRRRRLLPAGRGREKVGRQGSPSDENMRSRRRARASPQERGQGGALSAQKGVSRPGGHVAPCKSV